MGIQTKISEVNFQLKFTCHFKARFGPIFYDTLTAQTLNTVPSVYNRTGCTANSSLQNCHLTFKEMSR